MSSAGIDYGAGITNVDRETGIRYGVISQHDVSQAWCDSSEPIYGEPTCPKCGNEVSEDPQIGKSCDFYCESCDYDFDSDEAYPEEPLGYSYEGDGYKLTDCLDSDIFVLASPFYTFARFCSPCVPGAGNLNDAGDEDYGVKTYCLGHDWFDDNKAPYPVYSVETGKLVEA